MCRHPESWLPSYDLVVTLASHSSVEAVVVYGVQNSSPKNFVEHAKVRFAASVQDSQINIDEIARELAQGAGAPYDAVLVVHTLNVVAMTLAALRAFLQSVRTLAVCEMPRDGNAEQYYRSLAESRAQLRSGLTLAATTTSGRTLLERHVGGGAVLVVPPVLRFEPFTGCRPCVAEDEIRILAIGRIDTALLMFVDFQKRFRGHGARFSRVRLLLSVDDASRPSVDEILTRELGPTRDSVTLLQDVAMMSHAELLRVYRSCHVVVHANHVTDASCHVRHMLATGHPQVVPNTPGNTASIPTAGLTLVKPSFTFYNFDEYGGRLSMCDHVALAAALHAVVTAYKEHRARAASLQREFMEKYRQAYDGTPWLKALGIIASSSSVYDDDPVPSPLLGLSSVPSAVPQQRSMGGSMEQEVKELRTRLKDLVRSLGMNDGAEE